MDIPGKPRPRRAVFFDRDGTLMTEVDFCGEPAKVHAFPGAAESLAELRRHGWLNILITNQSGIGRGYFTTEQYHLVNQELLRQLRRCDRRLVFLPGSSRSCNRQAKTRYGNGPGGHPRPRSFRRNPRGSLETRPAISFAERPPAAEPSSCSPVMAANTGRAARTLSRGISSRPRK